MITRFTALAIAAACGLTFAAGRPALADGSLTVLVASSTLEAMQDVAKAYQKSHPGTTITVTPNGSAVIVTEIHDQLPADVVVIGTKTIGDPAFVDPAFAFVERTTIVVAKNSSIHSAKDLANPGVRIAWGTTNSVNAKFAQDTVDALGQSYGPAYVQNVLKNVVLRRSFDVAEEEAINSGLADAAIVLASDIDHAKFREIDLGAQSVKVSYSVATVKASKNPAQAADFARFVTSPTARQIFQAHGGESGH